MKTHHVGQALLTAALLAGASGLVRATAVQAKSAMEEDLSHTKQLSVAAIIYSSDADERFPLAYAPTPQGGYRNGGRFTLRGQEDYQSGRFNWAFAIYPYIKSASLYAATGAPRQAVEGEPDAKLPAVGHSYNGLLNQYLSENVTSPSATPLFTQSYGFVNLEGWAVANPEMTCVANRPCEYRPAARGCGGTEPGTTSRLRSADVPQFGTSEKEGKATRFQSVSYVDGHAKTLLLDAESGTDPYSAKEFFWSRLDGDGAARSYWADPYGCHPLRFRPDYDPERERLPVERARS